MPSSTATIIDFADARREQQRQQRRVELANARRAIAQQLFAAPNGALFPHVALPGAVGPSATPYAAYAHYPPYALGPAFQPRQRIG
ncbi:hypothetical protein GH865_01780 [Rhodocyclus tenuis]|uniref:Uncharacterized protein n=1 Tax=Rhodocyclus tenuis TaxID=1066 RepID=A0A6L5JUT1_RHOTE|nr:hypothetical protein [Rhodocyclus gracilis]MQY51133.1 hypothetical protein [Rhodocyclus gracilis]MRD71983.1 hypothetical protein [Rhodocyclus gracilis]